MCLCVCGVPAWLAACLATDTWTAPTHPCLLAGKVGSVRLENATRSAAGASGRLGVEFDGIWGTVRRCAESGARAACTACTGARQAPGARAATAPDPPHANPCLWRALHPFIRSATPKRLEMPLPTPPAAAWASPMAAWRSRPTLLAPAPAPCCSTRCSAGSRWKGWLRAATASALTSAATTQMWASSAWPSGLQVRPGGRGGARSTGSTPARITPACRRLASTDPDAPAKCRAHPRAGRIAALRLVNGSSPASGRLQVRLEGTPGWGTVCGVASSFNQTSAAVACKQLGYDGGGIPLPAKAFGEGASRCARRLTRLVWRSELCVSLCCASVHPTPSALPMRPAPCSAHVSLVNVMCSGDESSLNACAFQTQAGLYCDHSQASGPGGGRPEALWSCRSLPAQQRWRPARHQGKPPACQHRSALPSP